MEHKKPQAGAGKGLLSFNMLGSNPLMEASRMRRFESFLMDTWRAFPLFLYSLEHLVELVEDSIVGGTTAAVLFGCDLVKVKIHVHFERLPHLWEMK